jgi:hypothetical protein
MAGRERFRATAGRSDDVASTRACLAGACGAWFATLLLLVRITTLIPQVEGALPFASFPPTVLRLA